MVKIEGFLYFHTRLNNLSFDKEIAFIFIHSVDVLICITGAIYYAMNTIFFGLNLDESFSLIICQEKLQKPFNI